MVSDNLTLPTQPSATSLPIAEQIAALNAERAAILDLLGASANFGERVDNLRTLMWLDYCAETNSPNLGPLLEELGLDDPQEEQKPEDEVEYNNGPLYSAIGIVSICIHILAVVTVFAYNKIEENQKKRQNIAAAQFAQADTQAAPETAKVEAVKIVTEAELKKPATSKVKATKPPEKAAMVKSELKSKQPSKIITADSKPSGLRR